jgi:hypothetical protein
MKIASSSLLAKVNQHPPMHHEGFGDNWSQNNFMLRSSSLANHGG